MLPAVVDFPTPPLPDATAITCLIPRIDRLEGNPRRILSSILTLLSVAVLPSFLNLLT